MATSTESARLRVVGQELEQRRTLDFDVFVEPEAYRVLAYPPAGTPKAISPPRRKLTDLFKPKPPVSQDPDPPSGDFERSYSRSDIERLDDMYKARRVKAGTPDDYAVSQVLRVIGAYVEQHNWVLAGVSRKGQVIEIRHRDADGHVQTSEQKYAALYDFAVHMFSARRVEA